MQTTTGSESAGQVGPVILRYRINIGLHEIFAIVDWHTPKLASSNCFRATHTFDNTPHRLVLPRPPFFWAGCGFTLASFSHTCVCPLVQPLCSSVPQTVTTTQYHSVSTSNGSPSSRATCLLRCFTQVSDMVFTTQRTQSTTQCNYSMKAQQFKEEFF